mmetsp:Transcript_4922/g.11806  ORF Transcript_4922/g.11806 Transcript_4922/m.11806 type:complete len:292 (-) Transcript_4922:12381-13256(-)
MAIGVLYVDFKPLSSSSLWHRSRLFEKFSIRGPTDYVPFSSILLLPRLPGGRRIAFALQHRKICKRSEFGELIVRPVLQNSQHALPRVHDRKIVIRSFDILDYALDARDPLDIGEVCYLLWSGSHHQRIQANIDVLGGGLKDAEERVLLDLALDLNLLKPCGQHAFHIRLLIFLEFKLFGITGFNAVEVLVKQPLRSRVDVVVVGLQGSHAPCHIVAHQREFCRHYTESPHSILFLELSAVDDYPVRSKHLIPPCLIEGFDAPPDRIAHLRHEFRHPPQVLGTQQCVSSKP